MKKILYGICGIGNGHFFRQLPVIEHLISHNCKILFFAYGESLKLLQQFSHLSNIKILEVSVPYFIGTTQGIDFTQSNDINSHNGFNYNINLQAFSIAQQWLGKPDLVISDYEPICAQYAYAHQSKLLTIDQQSKFFTGNTPKEINGLNCLDEVMRLNMFFPLADRIACSFFKVQESNNVKIIPPLYREKILNLQRNVNPGHFLVYLSAQKGFTQNLDSFIDILSKRTEHFHIFTNQLINLSTKYSNLHFYSHGDTSFEHCLTFCEGIISTAGHNLLSEAMFLNIPVYAMPMQLYEQQLNAYIIEKYNFGINSPILNEQLLVQFISNISHYQYNIVHSNILFKFNDSKETSLIDYVQAYLHI